MKKIFSVVLTTIMCVFISSCSKSGNYERTLKKAVKTYLNSNLKDPDSVKDLKITYAILTQDEIDKHRAEQEANYINNPAHEVMPLRYYEDDKKAIILVEYRAKNSYGGYVKGTETFVYYPYGSELLDLSPLKKGELYLFKAMLYSPNKKVLE